MTAINYVKKRIGQTYLVWFQNSNLYTQLEEPAWFVFRKTVKRYKAETIASECSIRYGLSYDECFQFVNDIRSNIKHMNLPVNNINRTENYPEKLKNRTFIPYSIRRYLLADKLIEFSFGNQEFESYIHPLISYLETDFTNNQKSLIELFNFQNKSVLRLNGEIKGIWTKDKTHRLIGFTYMTMINEMYNKTDDFWLMTVHAAALTNGRKTILIPAESGSGKSTMAALLQNNGYQLVCDDFIPIDRHLFRAWSFPIAMSIKSGAMKVLAPIYPELESITENHTSTKKIVRYLPPATNPDNVKQAYPVKDVISVKYDPNIEFELKKADRLKSIKLMLDQSWILPNSGNAGIFLDQAAQWSFYELTYSNNQMALDAISKIFDHD
jgi:hypothetical protein